MKRDIILAGVGGQGILSIAAIIATAAVKAGMYIKQAEVHGMSQRGGSVMCDVRFGPTVWSPMVPAGDIAGLEAGVARLEDTLARLSSSAIDRELDAMAFPNRMPVAGSRVPVSSQFGTRHDPFTGRLARHTGLDIPAQYGTPILASGGGRVVFSGRRGAYGQAVVIDHGDGLATLYGHASRLLVRAGDIVLPQQKIALVGSTGRSTGPHLHFEVIRKGHRVEPRQYLAHVLGQRPGLAVQ